MVFFFNDTATTEIYTLSLHDALPISSTGRSSGPVTSRGPRTRYRTTAHPRRSRPAAGGVRAAQVGHKWPSRTHGHGRPRRSAEHTSELQSRQYLVCRLLLEKNNIYKH